jgi:hypothetical protein
VNHARGTTVRSPSGSGGNPGLQVNPEVVELTAPSEELRQIKRDLRSEQSLPAIIRAELGGCYYSGAQPRDMLAHLMHLLASHTWDQDREMAAVVKLPAQSQAPSKPVTKKSRLTRQEANEKAMRLAKANRSFVKLSSREWAEAIGCSAAHVVGLPFWKATMKRRKQKSEGRPSAPKAVSYTPELEAATKKGKGNKDNILNQLIAEQEADAEPSPLEKDPPSSHPKRVRCWQRA